MRLWKKRPPESELSHFYDIVADYGTALDNFSHMTLGVPRSSLPYSLLEIKEAIIKVALDSLDEPDYIKTLKAAYMMLATFIEDEEALRYDKARLDMAAVMEKSPLNLPELAKVAKEFEAAAKAQDAILEGIRDNKTVFEEVVGKLKVRIN